MCDHIRRGVEISQGWGEGREKGRFGCRGCRAASITRRNAMAFRLHRVGEREGRRRSRHRPALNFGPKLEGGEWPGSARLCTFAPLVFQPPRPPEERERSNCLSEFDNGGPSLPCKIHERARTL